MARVNRVWFDKPPIAKTNEKYLKANAIGNFTLGMQNAMLVGANGNKFGQLHQ